MGLSFKTLRDQEEEQRAATSFTLTERTCLNADKSAVVSCNSPEAAFTLGGAGSLIPMADAERYGLTKTENKLDEQPLETKPSRKGKK